MVSAKSLDEFVAAVEAICKEWNTLSSTTLPWFRGQGSNEWGLIPGLYRGGMIPVFEREMVRDFRLSAALYLDREPASNIEWLFVMQHYGAPTRLLDWTENSLAALYFAVEEPNLRTSPCVWVLDPWSLNQISLGAASIPSSDHPALDNYVVSDTALQIVRRVKADLPAAVRPLRATRRILAQKGVFTIHGNRLIRLNEISHEAGKRIRLEIIVIAAECRKEIKRQLATVGITAATLFPDLEGICREVAYRYSWGWDYRREMIKDAQRNEDQDASFQSPERIPLGEHEGVAELEAGSIQASDLIPLSEDGETEDEIRPLMSEPIPRSL
jgi:FRG domain-containing protein